MPDELSSGHLLRRLLALGVFIALVAVAVGSLPGLGSLRGRFAAVDPWLLVLIGVLKLGSCLSNVVAFRDVFCPRMSRLHSPPTGSLPRSSATPRTRLSPARNATPRRSPARTAATH